MTAPEPPAAAVEAAARALHLRRWGPDSGQVPRDVRTWESATEWQRASSLNDARAALSAALASGAVVAAEEVDQLRQRIDRMERVISNEHYESDDGTCATCRDWTDQAAEWPCVSSSVLDTASKRQETTR